MTRRTRALSGSEVGFRVKLGWAGLDWALSFGAKDRFTLPLPFGFEFTFKEITKHCQLSLTLAVILAISYFSTQLNFYILSD